jgi:hypothetical protein
MDNLGNKPIIVFIGLVASIISIYVFVSGRQNLRQVYREPAPLTQAPVQVQAMKPVANLESEPVLTFAPCVTSLACPDSVPIFKALGEPDPFDYNTEHSLDVNSEYVISFSQGWCTKDEALLHDHVPHLQPVFAVDGISYKDMLETEYSTQPSDEDPAVDMYCYRFGTGVSNWEPGVTYRINFGMIMDTDLYDGWENYTKGDYLRTYYVTGQ